MHKYTDPSLLKASIVPGAMEVLRTMRSQGVPFNKDTMTLATGTCYKLVMLKFLCIPKVFLPLTFLYIF